LHIGSCIGMLGLKARNVIATVLHHHYKEGLFKWVQDYDDAFTELILLGQTSMTLRNVVWSRMHKILAWLIPFLTHWWMISPLQKLAISLGHMPSDMINKSKKRIQDYP
jgi:hypothetical protein